VRKTVLGWWLIIVIGYLLLPWYVIEDGFWSFEWLWDGYPHDSDYAPAVFLIAQGEKLWLAPFALLSLPALLAVFLGRQHRWFANLLVISGLGGLAWMAMQGFGIGLRGFNFEVLNALFGELSSRQYGMGYGALFTGLGFLFLLTTGIGFMIALVALFILNPISQMLTSAVLNRDGQLALAEFASRFADSNIWGLGCLSENRACGAAWNSLVLAILVGFFTTLLGLVFALVATRSGLTRTRWLRALTVLPIITPPFVIGLAIILLFGLSGSITQFVAELFGIQPTRWV